MKTEMKATHTPRQERMAQDLAVELGHLNKGIPSLIGLYAVAPELLEAVNELRKALEPRWIRTGCSSTEEKALSRLRHAIAEAEGR